MNNYEMANLSDLVARSCRLLGKMSVTHGSLGHVSCRVPGTDNFLIKCKGRYEVALHRTLPTDIIEVDAAGNTVSSFGEQTPPGETAIHTWIYRTNPDAKAVIHVHPKAAVLLTTCGKEIFPFYGAYWFPATALAADGLPIYPSCQTVSSDEEGEDFARYMGTRRAALMYGHGATVVGESVEDATVTAIALDQLLSMTQEAYLLGGAARLADKDVEEIRLASERWRRPDRIIATFRDYCEANGE